MILQLWPKKKKIKQPPNPMVTPIKTVQLPNGEKLMFYIPSRHARFRAKSLLTKEPGTIAWLDQMNSDDVLWDIGSNVGVYSLYASKVKKTRAIAFEPCAGSYYYLTQNVLLNELSDYVYSYPLSFAPDSKLDILHVQSLPTNPMDIAASGHRFGNTPFHTAEKSSLIKPQPSIGFKIDDFVSWYQPTIPSFLKMDVDGLEGPILTGAKKFLLDTRLKSLLIEITYNKDSVLELLHASGFKQVSEDMKNYIFVRA